jgi:hypothetical protein
MVLPPEIAKLSDEVVMSGRELVTIDFTRSSQVLYTVLSVIIFVFFSD